MYDQFYALQGRPFQLTPDPHFYFESATHRKALSYLGYGLAQGEGFIVITGDIGAGKTTLVGHLMATIDPARLTAVKIVSTQVEGDDMLRLAAQSFGLPADGVAKAQLLQRIEGFLHAQARAGRRSLLIVDEAQNLPVSALEELRMLSNFQLGGQSLLQIFLLGQPEFRDLLKSPELEQLRQRVIATHHLDPMMASEIEPYIVHRLTLVGWSGNPRLTAEAYAAFYRATGGVPRRVNALASRVLLLGAIEQLGVIDADVVEAVAAEMNGDSDASPEPVAASPLDIVSDEPIIEADVAPVEEPAIVETLAEAAEPAAMPLSYPTTVPDEEIAALRAEIADLRARIAAPAAPSVDPEALKDCLAIIDERLNGIEARAREQDAALRRVLTLLVDWVEREERMLDARQDAA
jgi:general secretion pathway protein A